jgi:hypothetical protein
VCLVNRKEAENKEEIRAARSPRGFSNLDFKNEGSKSAQSHLINEIETDSIDLSRLDQTFLNLIIVKKPQKFSAVPPRVRCLPLKNGH